MIIFLAWININFYTKQILRQALNGRAAGGNVRLIPVNGSNYEFIYQTTFIYSFITDTTREGQKQYLQKYRQQNKGLSLDLCKY